MAELLASPRELVQRAADLVPQLRESAPLADAERRLSEETIQSMVDAGMFRVWTPRRYGGYEADVATHLAMTTELSRGCPAAGWTLAMMTTTSWMAGLLPDRGREEIFGADPDARLVGLFTATTEPAIRTEGGYIINGSKPFATGCLHATWAEVLVPLLDDEGAPVNALWTFVPMSEVEIQDTWFTMGLRGTGSHTLIVRDVFVPEYRTLPMMGDQGALGGVTRNEHREETLYRVPIGMLARVCFVGSCLGIAKQALEYVLETLPKRSIQYGPYIRQSDAVSSQIQIAEVARLIDTAQLHAERAALDCWTAAESGEFPNVHIRARCGHDAPFAIRTCKQAVDMLLYLLGASSVAQGNPLERLYRDISTGTLHGVARTDATEELYGSVLCGHEPSGTFIF
jgi:alkylation response protein AidB-like acyl-CoA dehydrogenase